MVARKAPSEAHRASKAPDKRLSESNLLIRRSSGLKEAKALVDEAPRPIKESVSKEKAEKINLTLAEVRGEKQSKAIKCRSQPEMTYVALDRI